MLKHYTRFWWTALLLAWGFDFLFWEKTPGINFAIFMLLCIVAGFWLLLRAEVTPAKNTWFLLLPISVLTVMTVIRLEPLTVALSVVSTLLLLAILTVTYRSGEWGLYSLSDHMANAFRLIGATLGRPFGYFLEHRKKQPEDRQERRNVMPIVRGILIALPIIAIFASLLSEADLIFSQHLEAFIDYFSLENLPEYLFRGFYILLLAYILAGIYLYAAERSRDVRLIGVDKPAVSPFLGFTETSIVFGSVLTLFAFFVLIQFQYFFGGEANITAAGFTYSEYARRGFGELNAVAFFSLLLMLGLSSISQREARQQKIFSGMSIGLVALLLVMLFSALQRLLLYEAAYGFSRLRTYSHVFMFWLAALLIVVALFEVMQRRRFFANAALFALLGFNLTLGLLNVDGFITRHNINRTITGASLDIAYLNSLSEDAVPVLADLYFSKEIALQTREKIGASLLCHQAAHKDPQKPDWRSFHFSRWRATQELNRMQEHLQSFTIDQTEWPTTITTPNGVEYPCFERYY